ncbi:SAM-dependent methyltransferase [Marinicauda salina]|uniref:SAM-dependent methyltransferase n=1 Tax=Marinicauda salina TaxID=2135793 RepID=A0A2U2BWT2_9PROT|nr:methyltransferase domain-containing protein [Marinicauda salina]PWE18475.1 SAM-dependent methyltransferase [Marinicauda salina]
MTFRSPNDQYSVVDKLPLQARVIERARKKMYEKFLSTCKPNKNESILDIGATSDRNNVASNYLEAWYPVKKNITAIGLQDASFLMDLYPGLKFLEADGRSLPFTDNAFDIVHSSAVIEHAGSNQQQQDLLSEQFRVARKAVFLTTPNRGFPLEVHTSLPLIHWLPMKTFRKILTLMGYDFFAQEKNLNLLYARDLRLMCRNLGVRQYKIDYNYTFGWASNILLSIFK